MLQLNNADARAQLVASNAQKTLHGLSTMGSGLLREEAGNFKRTLDAPAAAAMGTAEHVQAARRTRIRYDNVRHRAMQLMSGWEGEARGRVGG